MPYFPLIRVSPGYIDPQRGGHGILVSVRDLDALEKKIGSGKMLVQRSDLLKCKW